MGLNLSNGESFKPFVKYNAKAGRWYTKKDNTEVEVVNPVFIADLENIKTGWFLFMEGQGPQIVLDKSLTEAAPKPGDNYKRGFKMDLFSTSFFGGAVEFSANSMHICASVNDLYSKYEEGVKANPGKLPVVAFTGTETMKDKMGTNFKPIFAIQKWVDRPDALKTATPAPQAAQQPVAAAKTAPVAAGVSEF